MSESAWSIDVSDHTFEREVLQRSKKVLVVVDFWASWCDPCRRLSPTLEKTVHSFNGRVVLAKVDVEQNPGITDAFQVQTIPFVCILKNRELVDGFLGEQPEETIREMIQKHIPPEEIGLRGTAQPDEQNAAPYTFSPKDCAEAVGRAQKALSDPRAVGDINRRLGTRAVEVLAVVGVCIGLDPESVGSSRGIPVMQLDKSVLDYLGLNPDDFAGINFAWTLGVANDTVLGPIPTLFLCSRYRTTDRIVALVWSLTKCTEPQWKDQRGHFNSLLFGEMEDISWPGAEGGHVAISELTIMVNRPSGGLDLKTQKHIMPHKIWAQLEMSLSHNATTRAFQNSAPTWPYPTDMSEDGVFDCPGAGQFMNWY